MAIDSSGRETPVPTHCGHCGLIHDGVCGRIKTIEYYPDGTTRRVEYHDKPLLYDVTPMSDDQLERVMKMLERVHPGRQKIVTLDGSVRLMRVVNVASTTSPPADEPDAPHVVGG